MKSKIGVVIVLILLFGATALVSALSEATHGVQIVRQPAELILTNHKNIGDVEFWNTRHNFMVSIQPAEGWYVSAAQIYAGKEAPPVAHNSKPLLEEFNCNRTFNIPEGNPMIACNLMDELEFTWGRDRSVSAAIHVDLVLLSKKGTPIRRQEAWAYYAPAAVEWKGSNWGWYLETVFTHPARGHFIDSPVGGITFTTPTQEGVTDLSGGFDYFPQEVVELSVGSVKLGTAVANHKISPLDIFESADIHDLRVVNMARFLQSLDANASPKEGIDISEEVIGCLNYAVAHDSTYEDLDFADGEKVEALLQDTMAACAGVEDVTLAMVTAEDAKDNLDKNLSSEMFRKNVSKSPAMTSSKSKLDIMGMWFPARKANGDPATFTFNNVEYEGIPYYDYDEDEDELVLLRAETEAKPIVIVYTDGVAETDEEDIFAGISRDDGNTFKRKNLSRAADRSSFELEDGSPFYGAAKKPVVQVKGNKILVAWTSKYCQGGKPRYAIKTCDDPATPEVETPETGCAVYCTGKEEDGTLVCEPDDYPYDDAYYEEDIWGIGGPQRSVDYTEQGFPEVGEVPYSCVWTARGTIVTQGMINSSSFWAQYVEGDIIWYKPERLTSGRRDANQIFMGGADGAGFAIAWQEDPEGLRPGGADGPGPGWGGATTNHKTDIWYSYITWDDFAKVDSHFESGGDPQHDLDVLERPKALVPMSLPVRVSDNDVVNTDNLLVELGEDGFPVEDSEGNWIPVTNDDTSGEGTGSHAYGYAVDGLCEDFYEFTNNQDADKKVCITADGRLLDGDTGASRPNIFLQTYTKNDGTKSAWAIFAYEETKGVGGGAPDHEPGGGPYGDEYVVDVGKNAIYHSFDFQKPDLVSAGGIINLPERDEAGNLIYLVDEEGIDVLDYLGQKQLAYENARRPRFILQGKSGMGASSTPLIVLYKEGQEGQGRPSDIMLRRFEVSGPGNPYAYKYLVCNETATAENGQEVCIDGAQNMSSVTPTVTWTNPDSDLDAKGDGIKVIEWAQTEDNFADFSDTNPYDDARAHRGQIRGDFVVMGFSYTPNWAAARNGNDKYDFYVRRSFDGGQTWSTKPASLGGSGINHCITWTYPWIENQEDKKVEVCTDYGAGEFEVMRNLSQLSNSKSSVIEPRIVAVPGTIKVDGVWTGKAEDKQNPNVFYVSYGTSTNPDQNPGSNEDPLEYPAPQDLFYSVSVDQGEHYEEVAWDVNPDSDGNFAGQTVYRWDYLAKGDSEQGEAQLRMTPDGSRFYATWLQEGEEGSDIWFRRIMSPAFEVNNAPVEPETTP